MSEQRIITGEEYDEFLRRFNRHSDCTEHEFSECDLCGYLEWRRSCKNEHKRVIVSPLDLVFDQYCPRCTEVHRRNPEVVEWITRVIQKQMRPKP